MSTPSSVEQSLLQAVEDLQLRRQVESCVQELVTDVELATELGRDLERFREKQQLERLAASQSQALEESMALRQQQQSQQTELADRLVKELWQLSRQIGSYEDIKLQHETLLQEYDEMAARLLQAEEDLEEARAGIVRANEKAEEVQKAAEEKEKEKKEEPATADDEVKAATSEEVESPKETVAIIPDVPAPKEAMEPLKEETESAIKAEEPSTDKVAIEKDDTQAATPETSEKPSAEPPVDSVVTSTDDKAPSDPVEEHKLSLEDMDTETIMHIFGYLDALDILNTAQVNVSMYSRVDSLFGLGGAPEAAGGATAGGTTLRAPAAPAPAMSSAAPDWTPGDAPTMVAMPPEPAPAVASALTTAPTTAKTVTKITTTTVTTTPPPPQQKLPEESPTVKQHERTESDDSLNVGPRAFLNFLAQPMVSRRAAAAASSQPSSASASPMRGRAVPQSGQQQPMNAAMANSMAAKLSDAELNAIILMTERLKQKEALADKLVNENQEVLAKLDGTEAVKQFLIAKVRDMEVSLTKQEDNETKVARQIASDQEVIAFLDGRVQELERETKTLRQEKESRQAELERVEEQAEKKSVVMGDMLQFERERLSESEREWKATKKLLVKEVKNCRAQIVALQAERDGYREQNEILRKAVLSSGGNVSFRERAFT